MFDVLNCVEVSVKKNPLPDKWSKMMPPIQDVYGKIFPYAWGFRYILQKGACLFCEPKWVLNKKCVHADGKLYVFKGDVFTLTRENVGEERNFVRDVRTVLHNLTHKLDTKGYRRSALPMCHEVREAPCQYVFSIGKRFF